MTELQQYMLNNGILTKRYLKDDELQKGKAYDYDMVSEEKPVKKFYKMEQEQWKVYLNEKYDENNLPEGIFVETVNEPVSVKKCYELVYTGDLTKQEEIRLITEMKRAKMFSAITAYIYIALILTVIGIIGIFIALIALL